MPSLNPGIWTGLTWQQPHAFNRSAELRSGDSVIGGLTFVKQFGSLAEGRVGDQSWTLKRRGFLNPEVSVRAAGSEQEIATYKPNWTGTKGLILVNGKQFHLRAGNMWASEWLLESDEGHPLAQLHNKGFLKHGATLEVPPVARELEELPLLMVLCWYVLTLFQQDSSSSAAVIG